MKPVILYVSYDGMLEPLGQSQVLAYLERLAVDFDIHLVSFEKRADWEDVGQREEIAARIRAAGIHWHPRRYHKQPTAPATAFDVVVGTLVALWIAFRHCARIVHARSYVPSVMALMVRRLANAKFLFDMRGFWPDERADSAQWAREGRVYKLAKGFERRFLLRADHVISLTRAAVREMGKLDFLKGRMPPVTVIPTCADLSRFRPAAHAPDGTLVVGYVGTAGTWYRFDVTAACFRLLMEMRPGVRFLIVNRSEHDLIRARLAEAGVPESAYELRAANHLEVPEVMARMDAGVFFLKPGYSKRASSPTRLGEFLGCGVPCLSNAGIGDMAEILEGERVGVAVEAFEPADLRAGLERLLALLAEPDIRDRCVASAHRHFSLEEGVRRYATVYRTLLGQA